MLLYVHVQYTYFLHDDPYHLAKEGCDRWKDKNRQMIEVTVTLRLHFAVRVNNYK